MRRALLLTLLAGCTAVAGDPPPSPVELVLHEPTGRTAPSLACDVRLCTSLLELIERATTSLDLAVYGVRGQPAIVDALVAAQARGVVVRGVIDRTTDGKNYYGDSDRVAALLGTIRDDLPVDRRKAGRQRPFDAGQTRCWLTPEPGFRGPRQCVGFDLGDRCLLAVHAAREPLVFQGDIMHDKFAVVDGRWVWTGSTNVSDSCTGGYNANLAVVLDSPVVASWYAREFQQMYDGAFHEEKKSYGRMVADLVAGIRVEALFSPQDKPITRGVRPLLQQAKERIDVAIFFLTHKGIAADLIAAHRRGVRVRVVLDATAAKNEYTKHELLRAAGVPVKIEAWGGKMHMKAAAVDGRTVIAGSMNWTTAGESGNDENTLLLHARDHAAQFHAWFDALWDGLPDALLEGRPDPESLASGSACTDGVDNDYDHLSDADDPGCGPSPPPLPPLPGFTLVPKEAGQPLVKGVVDRDGKRYYWLPGQPGYDEVVLNPYKDELLCSEDDAREKGYRRAR